MLQWSTGSAKIIQKNMRLHVLSDLHQEFAPYRSSAHGADVIILAGDTHTGLNGIRWAQKEFDGRQVVYIAGNHEYYGKNLRGHLQHMRETAAGTNVLTEFVLGHPCRLWIHGHTHWAFDYKIGETRVLANPRGYPHETTHGFNPKLIVEV
jgi:predicted phosphodiesterase